jgi:hypothetical protein
VLDEMERERNFYYEKLREIEMLGQNREHSTTDPSLLKDVFAIL